MTNEYFNKIVEDQLEFCKSLLITKGIEYGENKNNIDRLHAFKAAAAVQNITPKEALIGMMAKHTISIYDMCKSTEVFPMKKWKEKITDHINYLLLLNALIIEEQGDY